MKYSYTLLILLLAMLLSHCASSPKKMYNIPPNLPEPIQKDLLSKLEKGKKLYKVSCAECHGIFTKGRDSIPNFSKTQMDNYSARFLARDPKNHAVAIKLNPEQLNEIFYFLRYVKKGGK